jgi:hypothetical protein
MARASGKGLAVSGVRRARAGRLRGVIRDGGALGRVITTNVVATGCLNRNGSMRARPERLGSMPIWRCEMRWGVVGASMERGVGRPQSAGARDSLLRWKTVTRLFRFGTARALLNLACSCARTRVRCCLSRQRVSFDVGTKIVACCGDDQLRSGGRTSGGPRCPVSLGVKTSYGSVKQVFLGVAAQKRQTCTAVEVLDDA